MNTILEIGNLAGSKSDRWLFIFAIIILIVGGVLAIRYLVARNEKALDENQVRGDRYTQNLQDIAASQAENTRMLAVVLERNTTAMNLNTSATNECIIELRNCRKERQHND